MIDGRYAAGKVGALHVIYNRYRSISEQIPTEEQVLPLKLQGPVQRQADEYYHYLPAQTLLAGLISEFVFIRLYRMAAESYASEQASRLVTMDGATRNAERLLNTMLDLERRERQGQVTRQTLELVGSRFARG